MPAEYLAVHSFDEPELAIAFNCLNFHCKDLTSEASSAQFHATLSAVRAKILDLTIEIQAQYPKSVIISINVPEVTDNKICEGVTKTAIHTLLIGAPLTYYDLK